MKVKDLDIVGYKVRLFPTKEQVKTFYEYFGMNRFVYNLTIDLQEEHYMKYKQSKDEKSKNKKFKRLSYKTLTTMLTKLKKEDKYKWLNKYSVDSIRGAMDDCCAAYTFHDNNFDHFGKPKFKVRSKAKKQFSVRNDTLSIKESNIWIPSIGDVKYCNSYGNEILGSGYKEVKSTKYIHYYNPRVSFDGLYFYLSFSIPKDEQHQANSYSNYYKNKDWQEQKSSEAIGIDAGIKNEKWFVDSTNTRIERPNSDVLNKKIDRLQRKYSRQKKANLKKNSSFMEQHPNGSKNMQKTRAKINKCLKKITNRRRNAVHEYAKSLLEKKPKAVVMESISVQNMINNHKKKSKLEQMIYDAALSESSIIIEKKMINNGIPVIRAVSDYASSQLCSCCGYQQNIGRRKIYKCPVCGTVIDRDLNAAINLAKLAY